MFSLIDDDAVLGEQFLEKIVAHLEAYVQNEGGDIELGVLSPKVSQYS